MMTLPSLIAGVLGFAGLVSHGHSDDAAGVEFFEKKIRPVLADHCFQCHSDRAAKLKGGLRLDSRAAMLKGGDNGPAVVPGKPDASKFLDAIRYDNVELQMPPKGKLPEAVIADLTAWVQMGALWPKEDRPSESAAQHFDLSKRRRTHWAWQPIRDTNPPRVQNNAWPRGPVDSFILSRLEGKVLAPAAPADRRTLIRRLTFNLIGLPPTTEEVEDYLNDFSPGATERVVDRLLASPHFGERWGRHWLDLVRYAETRGHEFDFPIPNAYQYRNYVIRALNDDVPYDEFVREHVAGDLLPEPRRHPQLGFNESIIGTGFWFLGEAVHSPVDIRQDEADRIDNMIDVGSKTFLGLTVACARCHDHKFDAISTKDYYALFGFLKSSSYRQVRLDTPEQEKAASKWWQVYSDARPTVNRTLADAMRDGVNRSADYLLAAREVILAELDSDPNVFRRPDSRDRERLTETAEAHQLDPITLNRWVAAIAAATETDDVLRLWARSCVPIIGSRQTDAEAPVAAGNRPEPRPTIPHGSEVIADYGAPNSATWMPDGFAWGPSPVRPGDLRWQPTKAGLQLRVVERASAEIVPQLALRRLAAGAEADPTSFGEILRAGRTIRTPGFTLNSSGRVSFLVKGRGRAHVAIGGYVLFDGPLHKNLIQTINTGRAFRWITTADLSAYAGQSAHVEFTAAEGSEFAVALVVQGAKPAAFQYAPSIMSYGVAAETDDAVRSLAATYQRAFTDTIHRIENDQLRDSPDAQRHAKLANWMIRRQDLFTSELQRKQIVDSVAPFATLQSRLAAELANPLPLAIAMWDGTGVDEYVFIRGSHKSPGERVPRRFLEALAGPSPLHSHGSGRLELAKQMTDPTVNPLIARVMVNRIWYHLFGRGIVSSVDNFGVMGESPTHPELLDYLADRFVRDGWSIKRLIRELVLSSTYQMSSQSSESSEQTDPENQLLHRMHFRRLDAESIRDAILHISSRLDRRFHQQSVPVYLTDHQQGRGRPQASGPLDGDGRRSVYVAVPRNFLTPFLLAFDAPTPFSTIGKRTVSNVPAQALILLNDPFVHQQAERWGSVIASAPGTTESRITEMFQRLLARSPSSEEIASCRQFLACAACKNRMPTASRPRGRIWRTCFSI